ncbi:hypothetical protein [Rurimicrobium arvi]
MKKFNTMRKFIPMAVLLFALMATVACTSNKKYGCPNHISAGFSLR